MSAEHRFDIDYEDNMTVTLELDDQDLECLCVTVFEASNGLRYIALLPLDENGENREGEVYLYRYLEKDGEPGLDNITDDEEYRIASDAFDEWLDQQEYDEIVFDD